MALIEDEVESLFYPVNRMALIEIRKKQLKMTSADGLNREVISFYIVFVYLFFFTFYISGEKIFKNFRNSRRIGFVFSISINVTR